MVNEAGLPALSEVPLLASQRRQSPKLFLPISLSVLLTGLLYATRKQDVSLLDCFMAFALVILGFVFYQYWIENNKTPGRWNAAPMLLIVGLAFVQSFALGIFWSARFQSNVDHGSYDVSHASCTAALAMAVLSSVCIYYAMRLRIGDTLCIRTLPFLKDERSTWIYCRLVLALGIGTAHIIESAAGMGGVRQMFLNFVVFVPITAFCILFRRWLEGEGTRLDAALLLLFALNKALAGIASGWIGPLLQFGIIAMAIWVSTKNRFPTVAAVAILAYVIFLQPGKERFRNEYWYGNRTGSAIERVSFWVQSSAELWGEALSSNRFGEKSPDLISTTADRASLISTTAQVIDFVPSILPYQNGSTYSFLLVSWIPRALWPNKPSASDVNALYQTSFRITRQENLDSVSIAPGILGEAYWNFGWAGVVIISMALGVLLRFLERQFGRRSCGLFMNSLIVITLPQFLIIESHMGTYLGGLFYELLVVAVAFAPVLVIRSTAPAEA